MTNTASGSVSRQTTVSVVLIWNMLKRQKPANSTLLNVCRTPMDSSTRIRPMSFVPRLTRSPVL